MRKKNIIMLLILGFLSTILIICSFITLLEEYPLYNDWMVMTEGKLINQIIVLNTIESSLLYGTTFLMIVITVVLSVFFYRRK